MLEGLQKLAERYEAIGDVRGTGLFVGADLVADRKTKRLDRLLAVKIFNRLREKRVLISASGVGGNILKIRPPLPFTSADNEEFLGLLGETLAELL